MKKGFSMIELSIVLVVLGLLIGGIMIGSALMDTSRVQSVIMDLRKYEIAANEFKQKYYYWPGDFPDADKHWAATEPGNGNGNVTDTVNTEEEEFLFWQHLNLAGYLKIAYDGSSGTTAGLNYPEHALTTGEGIQVGYNTAYNGVYFIVENITPNRALKIESNIDDAVYNTGIVHTAADADCVSGSVYDISSADSDCSIAYNIEGKI